MPEERGNIGNVSEALNFDDVSSSSNGVTHGQVSGILAERPSFISLRRIRELARNRGNRNVTSGNVNTASSLPSSTPDATNQRSSGRPPLPSLARPASLNGLMPQTVGDNRHMHNSAYARASPSHVAVASTVSQDIILQDIILPNHLVRFDRASSMRDRYRDMQLDVDNMSYEELLALEDAIGNVCTGVNEEIISSRLKQQKYKTSNISPQDSAPCCICQEEYIEGEDMGILECGHDFHRQCIKEWLKHKNLCPLCKSTGLNTVKRQKIGD